MERAKIGQMKNQLSRYLDHVRGGGEVVVCDRDRPIARLVPIAHAAGPRARRTEGQARLASLERRGLARRGAAALAPARAPTPVRLGRSLLRDLLADRETDW